MGDGDYATCCELDVQIREACEKREGLEVELVRLLEDGKGQAAREVERAVEEVEAHIEELRGRQAELVARGAGSDGGEVTTVWFTSRAEGMTEEGWKALREQVTLKNKMLRVKAAAVVLPDGGVDCVFQVVTGPRPAVESIMTAVSRDNRHSAVRVVRKVGEDDQAVQGDTPYDLCYHPAPAAPHPPLVHIARQHHLFTLYTDYKVVRSLEGGVTSLPSYTSPCAILAVNIAALRDLQAVAPAADVRSAFAALVDVVGNVVDETGWVVRLSGGGCVVVFPHEATNRALGLAVAITKQCATLRDEGSHPALFPRCALHTGVATVTTLTVPAASSQRVVMGTAVEVALAILRLPLTSQVLISLEAHRRVSQIRFPSQSKGLFDVYGESVHLYEVLETGTVPHDCVEQAHRSIAARAAAQRETSAVATPAQLARRLRNAPSGSL